MSVDFLNRINLSKLYNEKELKTLVDQSKHNLSKFPHLLNSVNISIEHNDNLSDNDTIIITKLISKVLLSSGVTDLYMADDWKTLAINFDMINNSNDNHNQNKIVNIKTLYTPDQWIKTVSSANTILSKQPPQNFIDKWPIIGSEEFRNRMKLNDRDAVITMVVAMKVSKGQKVGCIFETDDWELIQQLMKLE